MKNGGAFLQVGNGKPDNNSDNPARILSHVRSIRCMGAAA